MGRTTYCGTQPEQDLHGECPTAISSSVDFGIVGIVSTVAPGVFAQEGWCWRFVYVNPSGHANHYVAQVNREGPAQVRQRLGEGVVFVLTQTMRDRYAYR
jgi:hypothetical protein